MGFGRAMNQGALRVHLIVRCLHRIALILALACATSPLTLAQQARLIGSSRAGDRLAEKRAVSFKRATRRTATFHVNPLVTHQTIVGFGATFLEAGMLCLSSL